MMRGDNYFEDGFELLKALLAKETDPNKRRIISLAIRKFEYGIDVTADEIEELKMIDIRLPSFDGDMVGWLPDDFTYDDDDEDNEDNENDSD